MKSLVRFILGLLLFGPAVASTRAEFTSFYVFGDGISTTTNSPGGSIYYGNRYSNGRVWVEVLAQRQGLAYDARKNWSFFGHYSPNLLTNVSNWVAPADVNTALIVVWVNNADFVYDITQYAPYTTNNIGVWTNAINQSLSNHIAAVQMLYAKGARTLIMPNAADLTKVPYYVGLSPVNKSFIRQRIVDFNLAFATRLNQTKASLTNLAVYSPDIFALVDNLVAHPGEYGLTNTLYAGQSIDALSDPALADKSLNGSGTNYIFWDYLDPTAKAHAVVADFTQQLISPVRINNIASLANSNRLVLSNIPVGRDGFLDRSSNLVNWAPWQTITSTNATQTVLLPAAGSLGFYRLRFPFAWSWP